MNLQDIKAILQRCILSVLKLMDHRQNIEKPFAELRNGSVTHKNLGELGEFLALNFLLNKGWELIERNWRCALGEIDLVMRDKAEIVIVEVKTRKVSLHKNALEAVDARKQRKLRQLAEVYVKRRFGRAITAYRIDLIALYLEQDMKVAEIEHLVAEL